MNFDQAAIQSLKLRPTLVVGVGNFGGEVLRQIARKLEAFFLAPLEFPVLGLVWLDDQPGRPQDLQPGLSRLSLGLEQPARVLRKLGGAGYAHIHRWWYPGWSALSEVENSFQHSRPGGRVRFFHHYLGLRSALQEALARVRDPEVSTHLLNSEVLRQRRMSAQVQFDQPTQVHVVMGGWEGATGMAVDLGFLLRDLVPDGAVSRSAWVALPEAADLAPRANAYALLKELNHYGLERHGFWAEWEPGKSVRPQWTAYDLCYLQPGPVEESIELIADTLSKELLLSDFSEQRRSLRLNVQTQTATHTGELPEELQKRLSRGFSRLSSRRIRLAHGAVQQACAARLAEQSLLALVGTLTQGSSSSGRVLELLGEERACRRSWVGRLLEGQAQPLSASIQKWGQDAWRSLQRGHRSLSQHVQMVLQQGQRLLEHELLPQVAQQRQLLLAEEIQRLRTLCLDSVEKGPWTLAQVLLRLPETAASLRRWSEQGRRLAGELVERQRELAGLIARQQAELARAESRKNWDGRRSILIQHHLGRLLDLHLGSLDSPGLYLARVLQEAHQEVGLLCKQLAAVLQAEEPTGELAAELQLLFQQGEARAQQAEALVRAARADESLPLCCNLVDGKFLWQELYPRYVQEDTVATVVRAWLQGSRAGIAACLAEESWFQDLYRRCLRRFEEIPEDYALLLMLPRYEALLAEVVTSELAPVRGEFLYQVAGLPMPSAQASALQKAQAERSAQRLQQCVQQIRPGLTHFFPMTYGEELIWVNEAVALTASELVALGPLRDAYLHLYTQGDALHIECADQQFSDLAILSSEELQAAHEARETFLMASLLGVLRQEGSDWIWYERLPQGIRVHPLGEPHRLVPRLSKARALRQNLLIECRNRLEAIMEGAELQPLVEFASRLAAEKQRRWESDPNSADLELLKEWEIRIESTPLYTAHRSQFERCLHEALAP